jgi:uncharacterized surface protein with fasciclin (FAS1) repeats
MKKQFIAFLAAFVITGIVGLSMLIVGVNAAVNPNGVQVSNSPAQAATISSTTSLSDQTQVAQLQNLIAQYKTREQQYQTALQSDNTQLNQAAQEMQMVQQLLAYLQNRGIIQIDSQGQITVIGRSGN